MIRVAKPHEDMFSSSATALVNPVNTVGVMGAGLAKVFSKKFEEACKPYFAACRQKQLMPGTILAVPATSGEFPRLKWVIHFPTKADWRNPSKLEYVEAGLDELRIFLEQNEVSSVAIPALGCGLGGLPFHSVERVVREKLRNMDTSVILFAPKP